MTVLGILNPDVDELKDIFSLNVKDEEPILPLVEFNDTTTAYPKVDILENKTEFILRAEVPGFKKEELDVVFDDGVLTLMARRTAEETGGQVLYKERFTGNFVRQFQFSKNIRKDAIRASYRDGVLEIHLPKKPIVEKEIKIK
ncbi:MAG: Hsp20/alpha crystallin family protein [Calditrichaeota bacterium]|nr:Hsp20/alpha crystallin family protein [Calditrichota bacterium]